MMMKKTEQRYIVGIDLGTTNCALSYLDLSEETPLVRTFPIPQLKMPGEWMESVLLPSFLYLPTPGEIPKGSLNPSWTAEERNYAVGEAARNTKSLSRQIASAKSWLCHAGVNRRAKLLPWNGTAPSEKDAAFAKSPTEVTTLYLEHLRDAWNSKHPGHPMEAQEITITIPASFDESARELTLEAAEQAKLGEVFLLEEPLAAFYCHLDTCEKKQIEPLKPGETVLVIDIGGGTSDFSLIALNRDNTLQRLTAGDHLLLGGDNMDIAIARTLEKESGRPLVHEEFSDLIRQARNAKEKILNGETESADLIVFSKGASLIGGSKKFTLKKNTLLELLASGFFPECTPDTIIPSRGSPVRRMGLPYEDNPSIPLHLLEFLRYSAGIAPDADGAKSGNALFRPDKILFNGGTMIPEILRKRICRIVASWFPKYPEPEELESDDLSLAVSRGAVRAAAARHGFGVKVKCGTTRSYYIEVAGVNHEANFICVMPRGTEENIHVRIPQLFQVEPNKKLSFPLWSAHARPEDRAGDVRVKADGLHLLHDLGTVIRHNSNDPFETRIHTRLSESGILKLSLETKNGKQNWPLHFDIRSTPETIPVTAELARSGLEQGRVESAKEFLLTLFQSPDKTMLTGLWKKLEELLGVARKDIPLDVLRELSDSLSEQEAPELMKQPERFARWLNLRGFLLRPGFGDLLDSARIQKIWKLWTPGLSVMNGSKEEQEWWIFWRRVAPGLPAGQQRTVFTELWTGLNPKSKNKKTLQTRIEMWRCLASLERVEPQRKISAAQTALDTIPDRDSYKYWVLARLLSRRLFHATADRATPAKTAEETLKKLMAKKTSPELLFAIRRIASVCGDRAVDISPEYLTVIKNFLREHGIGEETIHALELPNGETHEENAVILGEALPLGLTLIEEGKTSDGH